MDRTRMLLVVLLSVMALQYGLSVLEFAAPGHGEDIAKHWLAPRVLAAGQDPYDPQATARMGERLGLLDPARPHFHYLERYHYPPLNLLLFAPLSLLSLRSATLLWLFAGAVIYLLTIPLMLSLLRIPPVSDMGLFLEAALLGFAPALGVLSLGQMEIVVVALIVAGLALDQHGRPWAAGLPLALAILIKLLPVTVVLYCLLMRRWRMLASIVLFMLVLSAASLPILGTAPYRSFAVTEGPFAVLSAGWEQYLPSNLSLPAFVLKGAAFLTGTHDHESAAQGVARALMLMGWVLVLGIVVRSRGRGQDAELAALGVVFISTSLLSSMTFQHHLLWLALPLGLALRDSWEAGDPRRFLWTFLAPYLLVGRLDPWNQPLRDLTEGGSKTTQNLAWSIFPAAIAAGAILMWITSARFAWTVDQRLRRPRGADGAGEPLPRWPAPSIDEDVLTPVEAEP